MWHLPPHFKSDVVAATSVFVMMWHMPPQFIWWCGACHITPLVFNSLRQVLTILKKQQVATHLVKDFIVHSLSFVVLPNTVCQAIQYSNTLPLRKLQYWKLFTPLQAFTRSRLFLSYRWCLSTSFRWIRTVVYRISPLGNSKAPTRWNFERSSGLHQVRLCELPVKDWSWLDLSWSTFPGSLVLWLARQIKQTV